MDGGASRWSHSRVPLGCHGNAVRARLGSPIGEIPRRSKFVPLYDPDLLWSLRDDVAIVRARERQLHRLSDADRAEVLCDALNGAGPFHLKRVDVEAFRSIEEANFDTSSLTVLVGRNGAGKSSILEAIQRQLAAPSGRDPSPSVAFTVSGSRPFDSQRAREIGADRAIGESDAVAASVILLVEALLARPTLSGVPGRWVAALALDDTWAKAGLVAEVGEAARSTDERSLLYGLLSAAEWAFTFGVGPIERLPIQGPHIRLTVFGADPGFMSDRLYEEIPRIAAVVPPTSSPLNRVLTDVDPGTSDAPLDAELMRLLREESLESSDRGRALSSGTLDDLSWCGNLIRVKRRRRVGRPVWRSAWRKATSKTSVRSTLTMLPTSSRPRPGSRLRCTRAPPYGGAAFRRSNLLSTRSPATRS